MPQMYGYKSVKWVERIELRGRGPARVLGAARLRLGRVARTVEWLLGRRPGTTVEQPTFGDADARF